MMKLQTAKGNKRIKSRQPLQLPINACPAQKKRPIATPLRKA